MVPDPSVGSPQADLALPIGLERLLIRSWLHYSLQSGILATIPLHSCPGDKVHNRGRILRCEWIMSLALLDDDLDFAAKFLV